MSRRIGLRYMQITGGKELIKISERFRNRGFELGAKTYWTCYGDEKTDVTQLYVHSGAWAFRINGLNFWLKQLFIPPYTTKEKVKTFEFWHLYFGGVYNIIYNGGLSGDSSNIAWNQDWGKINILPSGAFVNLPAGATIEGFFVQSNASDHYVDDFSCFG